MHIIFKHTVVCVADFFLSFSFFLFFIVLFFISRWVREMKTSVIRYRHLLGSQRVLIAEADAVKDVMVTHVSHYPRPDFLFG
jgi:hypothetical protein